MKLSIKGLHYLNNMTEKDSCGKYACNTAAISIGMQVVGRHGSSKLLSCACSMKSPSFGDYYESVCLYMLHAGDTHES